MIAALTIAGIFSIVPALWIAGRIYVGEGY